MLGLSSLCAHAQMTVLYQVFQNDVPMATEVWLHKPTEGSTRFNKVHQITKTRQEDKDQSIAPEQTRELETIWEKVIVKSGDTSLLRHHFIKHPTLLEPNEKSIGHIAEEELITRKVIDRWPFILSVTKAESKFWEPPSSMLKAQFEIFAPKMQKIVVTEIYDEDEYHFPYMRTVEIYNIMTNVLVNKTSYMRTIKQ